MYGSYSNKCRGCLKKFKHKCDRCNEIYCENCSEKFPHICNVCNVSICNMQLCDDKYHVIKNKLDDNRIDHAHCHHCYETICRINCSTDDPDYWKCSNCEKLVFVPMDNGSVLELEGIGYEHPVYLNEIYKLKEENRQLKEEIVELQYRPGAIGYQEAKADFNLHIEKN